MIELIAAVGRDGAIGRQGRLLWHIGADMRHFRQLTTGHAVIMGRKTFQSLPGGALPGRRNIVVSRQKDLRLPGAEVYDTLAEALAAAGAYGPQTVYVIGGAQIYDQAMPLADRLSLTQIDAPTPPDADAYFPAIDPAQWRHDATTDWLTDPKTTIRYRFTTLVRQQ